jgi:hypothetical protein
MSYVLAARLTENEHDLLDRDIPGDSDLEQLLLVLLPQGLRVLVVNLR